MTDDQRRQLAVHFRAIAELLDPLTTLPPLKDWHDEGWLQLALPARPYNAVCGYFKQRRGSWTDATVGDVCKIPDADLLRIENVGRKSVKQLRQAVRAFEVRWQGSQNVDTPS